MGPVPLTSLETGLVYVAASEEATVFLSATAEYRAGTYYIRGRHERRGVSRTTWVDQSRSRSRRGTH